VQNHVAERQGVTLHVNAVIVLDFVMVVGNVSKSISVKADVPLLQPAESSLNAIVDNKLVIDLPLNGRNTFDMISLPPSLLSNCISDMGRRDARRKLSRAREQAVGCTGE
jgi:hypothetical protein